MLSVMMWTTVMETIHFLNALIDWALAIVETLLPAFAPITAIVRWFLCRTTCTTKIPQGQCIGREVPEYYTIVRPTDKVMCFRGIPFARFQGRFQAPGSLAGVESDTVLNPPRWSPGFNFGTPGTACPTTLQFSMDTPVITSMAKAAAFFFTRGYSGSEEECLQLNVWVQRAQMDEPQRKLPVLVFYPGGAFVFGTCHQELTSGVQWAKKGCVVVNVNYRVGMMGYLRVPGRASNCGLRDQLEALRWVQRNIAYFGGDPENVTVSGYSAGAMSAATLLGVESLYEEKLAQKALVMSGTGHVPFSTFDAKRLFNVVMEAAGYQDEPTFIAALERMSTRQFMQLQERVEHEEVTLERTFRSQALLPFVPWVEKGDDVLPTHPVTAIEARKKAGKPLIPLFIGTTDNEYTMFSWLFPHKYRVPRESDIPLRLRQLTNRAFGLPTEQNTSRTATKEAIQAQDRLLEAVMTAYRTGTFSRRFHTVHGMYDAINGDFVFRIPSEILATTMGDAYVYRFDKESSIPMLRSVHIHDCHYIFGNWHVIPYMSGGYSTDNAMLSQRVMDDIFQFIEAKHPMLLAETNPKRWPKWDPETRSVKVYGYANTSEIRVVRGSDEKELQSWGDTLNRIPASINDEV